MQHNILDEIVIVGLNSKNFNINSLDNFILKQPVTKCWRKVDNAYKLLPVCYTEEWNLSERRVKAQKVLSELNSGSIAFAAITADNSIIGFALLTKSLFGSKKQYAELAEFYVSEPFRRRGIGKLLFDKICWEAKNFGATKLYISAHSAEESIAAYKKYGCVLAEEADNALIEKEPYDLQLDYDLSPRIYQVADKRAFLNLLLLADEQIEMVERYIDSGAMFVVDDCGVKGEITVLDVGNGVLEIKNLAVLPKFQRKGYAKMLINFICSKFKDDFSILQVGTGDSPLTLPFYIKCGFAISHMVKDFFIKNYDHPIVEAGIQLKDMIYLTKVL